MRRIIVIVLLFLLASGVGPALLSAQESPVEPLDVRVMSFNIWRGGELVDFGKVIEAIQASGADIVGLQESEGNARRIADALGWSFANERTQIISRFPLIDPPGGDGVYVYAQIKPGQVVAVANFHLPSDPYGPYAVRDGASLDEVLQLEADIRLPALQARLDILQPLIEIGMPLLITGDFNTPSHLDWTEAMIEARPGMAYSVEWPVSQAVEAAGFTDTYRAVHPDPVERAGITWTYGYPFPRLLDGEMLDRIDWVLASPDVMVLDSAIVGPEGSPEVDIPIRPYPSDHRGVVSTVRVTPAEPPVFVAVDQRRVEQGDTLVVWYHAPGGEENDRIAIVPAGGPVDAPLMWLPPYEASYFGSVTFGLGDLEAGEYEALLIGADGEELARSPFWIVEPGAQPRLTTDRAVYAAGEPIRVLWENAPALKWDWIGIYSADDPDLYNGYWAYAYTDASVRGETVFNADVLGEDMLTPGDYVARLLLDDGFAVLATARFTVGD